MISITGREKTDFEITEQNISPGGFFIGKTHVYYKFKKNDVIQIGTIKQLKKINYAFALGEAQKLFLLATLGGNPRITNYKGDFDSTFEKLVRESPHIICNVRNNKKDSIETLLTNSKDTTKLPTFYSNWYSNSIDTIKYYKESRDRNAKFSWYKPNDTTDYIINNGTDYMLGLFKYNKIIKHTYDNLTGYCKSDHFPTQMSNAVREISRSLRVKTVNCDRKYYLYKKFLKDYDMLKIKWRIMSPDLKVDTKTGDLEYKIGSPIGEYHVKMNLYTFDQDIKKVDSDLIDYVDLPVVLTALYRHYSTLDSYILDTILRHLIDTKSVHSRGTEIAFETPIGAQLIRKTHLVSDGEIIKKFITATDKIHNLDSKQRKIFKLAFGEHAIQTEKFLGKFKIHQLLPFNKNIYKELLELNESEKRTFISFVGLIKNHYPYLLNDKNINQLFDDTFLMISHSSNVRNTLSAVRNSMPRLKMSEFKKVVRYLDIDCVERQRIYPAPLKEIYRDYIRFHHDLVELEYRTNDNLNLTPYSLKLEHDILSDEFTKVKTQFTDKLLESKYNEHSISRITNKTYKYDNKDIVFITPKTTQDLKDEGNQLSHCVGTYATRIIDNKCLILFARDKNNLDKSWFTVELRITPNGYTLGQQQSIKDFTLPTELKEKLVRDIKKINNVKEYTENVA
ncbi:hypothetical protein BIPXVNHO_CDS0050 [Staphylococcus phage PG-2021_27]